MEEGKRKDGTVADRPRKAPRLDLRSDPNIQVQQCNHVQFGIQDLYYIHDEILSSREAPVCEACQPGLSDNVRAHIMVCTDCNSHFCSGELDKINLQGHARQHANQDKHWVALWYNEPFDGYCFKCKLTMSFRVGIPGDKGKDEISDNACVHESDSSTGDGYVIRGIPNIGSTCYMNALVQCLLALGKLRTSMLGPDASSGYLSASLKVLFVETGIANFRTNMQQLEPKSLLAAVQNCDPAFRGMQDSHDLFISMCKWLDEEEEAKKLRCIGGGAPTPSAMVSSRTTSIFRVQLSVTRTCHSCLDKSSHTEIFRNLTASMPSKDPPATGVVSSPIAKVCRSPTKPNTIAHSGVSQSLGSELGGVLMGNTRKNFQEGCTEVKVYQNKEGVQCPFEAQNKIVGCLPPSLDGNFEGVGEMTAESLASIEGGLISNHFKEGGLEDWRCEKCRSAKGTQTTVISKLPPVLVIHVKRYEKGNKLSGHVSFEEILDVGPFMDPSCEDSKNSGYRLVGVVDHKGPKDDRGHYVAYIRAGHKQQSSGSSCWFRTDDSIIEGVPRETVFNCKAYILFYERMGSRLGTN